MKRLETIHLRLANTCSDEFIESICHSYRGKAHFCIFRNEKLPGDIAIFIVHESNSKETLPSKVGLSLASALREYGMVEHASWKEQCSTKEIIDKKHKKAG
jgi:hypothetical protein